MQEAFAELKYANTASVEKSKQYFLETPPLPQEDLEAQAAQQAAKEVSCKQSAIRGGFNNLITNRFT